MEGARLSNTLRVSRRVSARSTLLLASGVLGFGFALVVTLATRDQPSARVVSILAITIAAASFAGLCAFLLTRGEVHLTAQREQTAALRRIATMLDLSSRIDRKILESARLEVVQVGDHEEPGPLTVDVFLKASTWLVCRTTLIAGDRGSGKSTLISRIARDVAVTTASGAGSYWPLIASAKSWHEGTHLSAWIEREMSVEFRVRRRVTNAWFHSGHAILLIDDLDDVPDATDRDALLRAVHHWQRRPSGGKVIVGVAPEMAAVASELLQPDRKAVIHQSKPHLLSRAMRQLLRDTRIFGSWSQASTSAQIQFLEEMASDRGISQQFVRAIELGLSSLDVSDGESSRTAAALLSADAEEDPSKAVHKYLAAASQGGELAGVALVRATLVEAGRGRSDSASRMFDEALELFQDLNPLELGVAGGIVLTDDERKILDLLNASPPSVEESLVVASGLLPSEVNEALKGLLRKGFAYTREVGRGHIMFYESALNDRVDGLDAATSASRRRTA